MKVLITGATGFIGSYTAAALLKAGHEVRVLVRNTNKLEWVENYHGISLDDYLIGDVTDAEIVSKALEGCDGVVHTAAMVSTSRKDAKLVARTNIDGTKNVIGQAVEKGLSHIVHVSSITAIYNSKASSLNEQSPPGNSSSAYGSSKVACEKYVRQLQAEGKPVFITYPTGVIGPGDPGFSEPLKGMTMFLKTMAVMSTTGIQYVDVRDVADIHVAIFAGESAPDRFMLGGFYYPWAQFVGELESLTGRELKKYYLPKPIMKALGNMYGFVNKYYDLKAESPMDNEAVSYATEWVYADSSKLEEEHDFTFRDGRQSIIDTMLWLEEAGHINKQLLGKLVNKKSAK